MTMRVRGHVGYRLPALNRVCRSTKFHAAPATYESDLISTRDRAFAHPRLVSGGIRPISSTFIRRFHAREIAPIIFYATRHISQFNPAAREKSASRQRAGSSTARCLANELRETKVTQSLN